jgi:hypothetical protein
MDTISSIGSRRRGCSNKALFELRQELSMPLGAQRAVQRDAICGPTGLRDHGWSLVDLRTRVGQPGYCACQPPGATVVGEVVKTFPRQNALGVSASAPLPEGCSIYVRSERGFESMSVESIEVNRQRVKVVSQGLAGVKVTRNVSDIIEGSFVFRVGGAPSSTGPESHPAQAESAEAGATHARGEGIDGHLNHYQTDGQGVDYQGPERQNRRVQEEEIGCAVRSIRGDLETRWPLERSTADGGDGFHVWRRAASPLGSAHRRQTEAPGPTPVTSPARNPRSLRYLFTCAYSLEG